MSKQKTNKKTRGFIFQGIWRSPVINLVTLIHEFSQLEKRNVDEGFRKQYPNCRNKSLEEAGRK